MKVFHQGDNPYPVVLFKAGYPECKYVSSKKEMQEAVMDGWSETPVQHDYPKWVGPHDEQVITQGEDKAYVTSWKPMGGKLCKNAAEEKAHLELIASTKAATAKVASTKAA